MQPNNPSQPNFQQPYPNNMQYGANPNMQGFNYGYGQQQPYVPPQAAPNKPPMDPKKKKKILIIVFGIIGFSVVALIGLIVLIRINKISYRDAYKISSEIKEAISDIDYGSCQNVVERVSNRYISEEYYEESVEKCEKALSGELSEKIKKLGETAAIRRDKELAKAYNEFKSKNQPLSGNTKNVSQALKEYKAWHKHIRKDIDSESTDEDVEEAISDIKNSRHEKIRKYAIGWKEKVMEFLKTARAYKNETDYKKYAEKRAARDDARAKLSDYKKVNTPNLKELEPISMVTRTSILNKYNALHKEIAKKYEENYDGSGSDCVKWFNGRYKCL